MKILSSPFPRPKHTLKNILRVLLMAVGCTLFILIFTPYNIENNQNIQNYYVLLGSLGLVFFLSIYFVEFVTPILVPRVFVKWTLLKALLWYAWLTLLVGGTMFLYKSYLGGFVDFTLKEYLFVIGRIMSIALIVSFFVFGISKFINKKNLTSLTYNETYTIQVPGQKEISLNSKELLYIASDDNYVDVHLESDGKRNTMILRCSLKNVERQIVSPLNSLKRCHRSYIVNVNHFRIKRKNSRQTTIQLKKYDDLIPVSKKYANQIAKHLQIRP